MTTTGVVEPAAEPALQLEARHVGQVNVEHEAIRLVRVTVRQQRPRRLETASAKPRGFEQSAHRENHAAVVFDYCDGAHPRPARCPDHQYSRTRVAAISRVGQEISP